jgi:hypothetical protein
MGVAVKVTGEPSQTGFPELAIVILTGRVVRTVTFLTPGPDAPV